jgi:RNA polymerase sigma factor (TIGR02999 family)
MDPSGADSLGTLVSRAGSGDAAAKDALFAALYAELHRLAQAHLHRSGGNLTLSPTTLLHEVYLDLAARDALAFPDRNRFLGYASRAMRGLIIDYIRTHRAQKRGADLTFTTLDDGVAAPAAALSEVEQLSAALDELAALEPSLAELVDLKFFCGFSHAEIAALRGVSERTVRRDWAKARVLLHQLIATDRG